LSTDLGELPVASLLWPFAPKLRTDVVELLQLAGFAELVFDIGAHDTSGILRPQCQQLGFLRLRSGPILPGVHFFRDDIRLLANASREEGRIFKHRRPDLAEVVAAKDGACRRLNPIP